MGFLGEANQRQNIIQQYCEMRHRSERDRERNIHIQISEHFLAKCQLNYQLHATIQFLHTSCALTSRSLFFSLALSVCAPSNGVYLCYVTFNDFLLLLPCQLARSVISFVIWFLAKNLCTPSFTRSFALSFFRSLSSTFSSLCSFPYSMQPHCLHRSCYVYSNILTI